ncbi:MAG: hypothetical protein COU27_02925 [Candidatus Levybacteria bacterium CG10_big_fil_rev_8_21_14_0_10_36_7]|nr:MAG: hypothetical protein COU27_02925 [Candidatus Levybacteria bacterium CG10_big_fil_rev_8_21_14_0_10_36_7]
MLADYTENNWQEHAESHTAGTPNSNFIREDEQTDDSDTDNQDGEDSDQDTEENDSGDSGDPEDDGSSDNPREKRILILQKIRELRRNYLEEFRKLLRQLRSIR